MSLPTTAGTADTDPLAIGHWYLSHRLTRTLLSKKVFPILVPLASGTLSYSFCVDSDEAGVTSYVSLTRKLGLKLNMPSWWTDGCRCDDLFSTQGPLPEFVQHVPLRRHSAPFLTRLVRSHPPLPIHFDSLFATEAPYYSPPLLPPLKNNIQY